MNVSPIISCVEIIHDLKPHREEWNESTSGAQINFNAQGKIRMAVSEVILSIGTFWSRRSVGSAHQMKPIGAPSLRYRNAKRIFLPVGLSIRLVK